MNAARKQSMLNGLTSIARKVYDAVPIQGEWRLPEIMSELGRQGITVERNKVEGCLAYLFEQGLIHKSGGAGNTARYIRDPDRPTLHLHAIPKTTEEDEMPKTDPMTNLANIAQQLRAKAAEMTALADKIDAAALDVAEAMESAGTEGAKFRQLKDLLASITK